MPDEDDTKRVLDGWVAALLEELGLPDAPVDVTEILRLAGVSAHSVIRPAAPVTTWIVGYAAGLAASGGDAPSDATGRPDDAFGGAAARAEALARRYGQAAP